MSTENQAVTVKLETPFEYEDKVYEKIEMNLEKLNGADAMAIEEELEAMKHTVIYPLWDGEYIRMAAARASGIAEDIISAMPIRNYVAILQAVRLFLVKTGDGEEIKLELEKLTGADYQRIEAELSAQRHMVALPAQDSRFLRKMVECAGGIKEEDLRSMPLKEYIDLIKRARDFLTS